MNKKMKESDKSVKKQSKKFFSIIYWNCARGFVAKKSILEEYLSENNVDVMFISECDINNTIVNSNCMKIDGYDLITSNNLERHDKTRLCAYIKSATRLKRIQPLEEQENEIIVLEDKTRLIAAIYRPFKCFKGETQETNFKRLITNLTKLHTLDKKGNLCPRRL